MVDTGKASIKLSRLQKQILTLALANKVRENRTFAICGADLYYSEILVKVYAFPIELPRNVADVRSLGPGKNFNPDLIGRAKYRASQAAISRAMRRLDHRGLATHVSGVSYHWSGCILTPEGVRVAETVNSTVNLPTN